MLGTFDFRFSALCEPTLLDRRLSRPGDNGNGDDEIYQNGYCLNQSHKVRAIHDQI